MTHREMIRRYYLELGASLILYTLVLVAALRFGTAMDPGPLRTAVLLSPMLPFLAGIAAITRYLHRADEFIRKVTLERLAVAAAVTAGWTFTYGFFENAGYPRLSMFIVWPVMGATWGILACVQHLRHR